LNSRPDG